MIFFMMRSAIAYTRSAAWEKLMSSEQIDPKTYKTSTKVDTTEGARTGLFVPERDALFVAVPHRGSQQAEVRWYDIE